MKATLGFGALLVTGALAMPASAAMVIDDFESHDWDYWFGTVPNPPDNPFHRPEGSAVEYSDAVSISGRSLVVKQTWRRASACDGCGVSAVRGVRSNALVPIPLSSITGDVTFEVYAGGSNFGDNDSGTGTPVATPGWKVELATTAGNAVSSEEALIFGDWKTFTVPQEAFAGDITELRFIIIMDFPFGSQQADGDWELYVDNMAIGGVVVDGFERIPVYGVEAEASGVGFEGPPQPFLPDPFPGTDNARGSSMNLSLVSGAPAAPQGDFAFVLDWSGDADGIVGMTANHANGPLDLGAIDTVLADIFIPAGQPIPTVSLGVEDTLATSTTPGTAIPSTGAWHTVEFDTAGFSGVDLSNVRLLNITATGAGSTGRLYIDHIRAGEAASVGDWTAFD